MSDDDPDVYPGSTVLRNKLGITDPARLDKLERLLVTQRFAAGLPAAKFDLAHLCAVHRHLFQDIYAWAGMLRTVEIAKGGQHFQFHRLIETGMADVHRRLANANFLHGLAPWEFASAAGRILGDVNYVHPFRECNGRTQLFYLAQLGEQAGHNLDLTRLSPSGWIAASREAHLGNYDRMSNEIAGTLTLGPLPTT